MRRVILLLLLLVATALPAPVTAETVEELEWDLVAQLNQARFQAGLDGLVVREDLRAMARRWSARMDTEDRLYHNPDLVAQVAALIPSKSGQAENVARAATAPRLHELWTASPPHRANMLGDYDYVGVGLAGQYWGTQVFVRAPEGLEGVTRVPVERITDATPIQAALRVSRASVPDAAADGVVVARSDVFPDALVGGPLAGAMGGPVLLSETASVSEAVVQEARRVLRPGGAVYLMGGPSALSPEVEARFLAAGMRVHRVAGTNRFDTAVQAANLLNPAPEEILLASGENFADALSAGVPAAVWKLPVVLAARDVLPPETALYLTAHPEARRFAIGGPAALGEHVAIAAGATERVSGPNRYATAVRVAERWFPEAPGVWVATGGRHQDPLLAVPAAARAGQPLLLVPLTGERTVYDYSRVHVRRWRDATVVGAPSEVRDQVLSLLFN